jgi:hypothetical protein
MPMHGPSLAETTAFVAVVELKSFTKAAKQLALSPPRVSEMVRNNHSADYEQRPPAANAGLATPWATVRRGRG